MDNNDKGTKKRSWKQLTYRNRLMIEALLQGRKSVVEISKILGYSKRTIERELKRGRVSLTYTKYDPIAIEAHMPRERIKREGYSAEVGQNAHDEAGSRKGGGIKLGYRHDFADKIEQLIGEDRLSPYAALKRAEAENDAFKKFICIKTLYNYIDNNYFLNISNKNLCVKRKKKKRKYNKT